MSNSYTIKWNFRDSPVSAEYKYTTRGEKFNMVRVGFSGPITNQQKNKNFWFLLERSFPYSSLE